MKLGYARIFVNELDGMVEFYVNTLGLNKIWHDAENAHAGFETGDCKLILEDAKGEAAGNRFTALSFKVPDIEATHQRLQAAKVEFTQPPQKMPWGGTLAYFKDPEGNTFGLVGDM